MSSIISDIFYNNSNNELIDNYLLHHNLTASNLSHPIQQNASTNAINNMAVINSSNNTHVPTHTPTHAPTHTPTHAPTHTPTHAHSHTLALRFSITIKCQSTSSNAQVGTRRGTVYYVRVKMGVLGVEEMVQPKANNVLQAQLHLDVTHEDIINHAAIAVEMGAKLPLPMACCYIPVQNIKAMLSANVTNKVFSINMKSLGHTNTGGGLKYGVKCGIDIQDNGNRAPSALHYKQIIKNSRHGNQYRQYRQGKGRNKRTYADSNNKVSGRSGNRKQQNASQNKYDNSNVVNRYPRVQRYDVSSNQWSELLSKSKSGWTNNQTDNLILQFQLDNNPIKFTIKQCQLNYHAYNHDISEDVKHEQAYKFMVANKYYIVGDQIVVSSSEVNKSGMRIAVSMGDGTQVGVFSLNIVLLLGGLVQGVFPINSYDANQCIGLVRLQASQHAHTKLKQTIGTPYKHMPQLQPHPHAQQQPNNSTALYHNSQPRVQGYVIQFAKVLLMKHSTKTPLQQLLSPNIIIRVGTMIVKTYKECEIRPVYANGCIVQLVFKQPIVVHTTCTTPIDRCIQVEIYMQYQLVGYAKVQIHSQMHAQTHQQIACIRYGGVLQNCSTSDWICNAAINYVWFVLPTDYFPQHRLSASMRCLSDREYAQILYGDRTDRRQMGSQVVNRIIHKCKGMIYIQASRIANLLLDCASDGQYCYLGANWHHREEYINTDKLLEQIRYVDSKGGGVVGYQDMVCIGQYYGLSTQLCELAQVTHLAHTKVTRQKDVLYLFVLMQVRIAVFVGHKLHLHNQPVPQQQGTQPLQSTQHQQRAYKQTPSLQLLNQSKQAQQRIPYQPPQQPNQVYHIQSVVCQQMHSLMATGSIPSIKVKVQSTQFTTRPCYSFANPVVRLNKKIKQGQTIIILHHNVKFGHDVEIARFVFHPGHEVYDINGKARVKLLTISEQ